MEVNFAHLSARAKADVRLVNLAIKDDDQNAYRTLMQQYHDSIYYMLLKMVNNREDAEDLTIETFSKAFKKLEAYTPTYAFSTWLFKIASNHGIDFIRKKRIKTTSIDQPLSDSSNDTLVDKLVTNSDNPEGKIIKAQRIKQIHEIVASINPKYAKLIALRYFDELSYEEIAQELDIPLGTVKVQLHRAKNLLVSVFEEQGLHYNT